MLTDLVNYQNKWVAISKDSKNILLSAKDFIILFNQIKKKRLGEKVTMMYVHPLNSSYAP